MLKWLRRLIFGNDLKDFLNQTKKVRVRGVRFVIRRVDVSNYLDGSSVMREKYAEYRNEKAPLLEKNQKKIRQHMTEVIVAGTVSPKIFHKQEDAEAKDGIWVEAMFSNAELAGELYQRIIELTYGKKKVRQLSLQQQNLEKLMSSANATDSAPAITSVPS